MSSIGVKLVLIKNMMILASTLRHGDLIGVFILSTPAHVSYRHRYPHGLQTLRALGGNHRNDRRLQVHR
jgi:hypothetical protein